MKTLNNAQPFTAVVSIRKTNLPMKSPVKVLVVRRQKFLIASLMMLVFLSAAQSGPAETADHHQPSLRENFMIDLHNQLVHRGFLNERVVKNSHELSKEDLSQFLAALRNYDKSRGGVLTPNHLYDAGETLEIIYDEREALFASLRNPDQTIPIGGRTGITDFRLAPVNSETPDLGFVIAGNVQTLYAQYVRNWYLNEIHSGRVPDAAAFRGSGYQTYLSTYLETLSANGLLVRYDFYVFPDGILLQIPENTDGVKIIPIELVPEFVNFFETVHEEARSVESQINSDLSRYFVYLRPDANRRPERFLRSEIEWALESAADAQRLNAPGEEIGYRLLQTSPANDSACAPVYDAYGGGTVTPKNTCITALRGPYLAPYSSEEGAPLKDILSPIQQYGYRIYSIDGRFSGTTRENFSAPALRYAQTYILDGHGRADGSFASFCYPNIPYGPQCCEALRTRAHSLGFATRNLDCAQSGPYRDDTGTLIAFDSGNRRCDDGNAPNPNWPGDAGNRCQINLYPQFFSAYGSKAAVFTGQCDAPQIGSDIMDYWSNGICQTSYEGALTHDADLVVNDLLGKNQSLVNCSAERPNHPSGPFCLGSGDAILGFEHRTIQGSAAGRGTTASLPERCETQYNDWNGFEKNCHAVVTGRVETQVEFAPSISSARLSFSDQGPQFIALFTSSVKPFRGSMTARVVGGKPRLLREGRGPEAIYHHDSAYGAAAVHELDASLIFNPTFKFENELEWSTELPQNMVLKYGHSQSEWPWYIEVTLSGVETKAGVKLDGNQTAQDKWIWPHKDGQTKTVEPWSNLRGVAANGDPGKFKIPLLPNFTCCMPNLEVRLLNPEDPASPAITVQNGCTCTEVATLKRLDPEINRWVPTCMTRGIFGTLNENQQFLGTVHKDYYSCCGAPICAPGENCDALPAEECRMAVIDNPQTCPSPPSPPGTLIWDTHYQFQPWPLDADSSVEQCPTIHGQCMADADP